MSDNIPLHPAVSNSDPAEVASAIAQQTKNVKPEWLRIPDAIRVFGISRSCLYLLISENKIRSTCLRKRGATKGIRILSYDSLAEYVNKAAEAGGIAA